MDLKPLADITDAGPESGNSGDDCGVDNGNGAPFQHNTGDESHLGDGANFAELARFNRNVALEVIENDDSAKDNDISGNDKCGDPEWNMPVLVAPGS